MMRKVIRRVVANLEAAGEKGNVRLIRSANAVTIWAPWPFRLVQVIFSNCSCPGGGAPPYMNFTFIFSDQIIVLECNSP